MTWTAIAPAVRIRLARAMIGGKTCRDAATECGVSFSYAKKMREQASKLGNGNITDGLWQIAEGSDTERRALVLPHNDPNLRPHARKALDDIGYFARRYFGLTLAPWQEEAADVTLKLLATDDEEYLVVNLAPGTGKSTFFTLLLPAWLTCRNRTIRGLIGSASQDTANWYLRRLRQALAVGEPFRAKPREIERGMAHDAQGVLAVDYGTFRPDERAGLPWRDDTFSVVPPQGMPPSEKENTWQAFGRSRNFLGARVDIQIWDDAYDPVQVKTPEARDELRRWWDEQVESRLEPGGLLIVQGQRLGPDDLYAHCIDKPDDTLEDEDDDEPVAAVDVRGPLAAPPSVTPETASDNESAATEGLPPKTGKYRHVVYKAHYEQHCTGKHPKTLKPYPDSCLLSPLRLSWRRLAAIKNENPLKFATLYQQDDTPVGSVLVHPLWIDGGRNPDTGEMHVGCWDDHRELGQLPLLSGPVFSCVTVDPSPTKWWAIQWWAFEANTDLCHLIDLHRAKMSGPDLIDWNEPGKDWTGLMPTWQERSVRLARPITHWVVEQNAAQRWLLQFQHVQRWMQRNSVTVVGHETTKNKSDPKLGVTALAPRYKHGRVRLPGAGLGRQEVQHLVAELTRWPQGRTDDQVMANWFFDYNLPRLFQARPNPRVRMRRPSFVSSLPDLRAVR